MYSMPNNIVDAGNGALFFRGWNVSDERVQPLINYLPTLHFADETSRHLITHCAGAVQGIKYALRHPDSIASLTMVAPNYLDGSDDMTRVVMALLGKLSHRSADQSKSKTSPRVTRAISKLNRNVPAIIVHPVEAITLAKEITEIDYRDPLKRLHQAGVKIGIVLSGQDELFPRNKNASMELADRIDAVAHIDDPLARHSYFLDYPDRVMPIIQTMVEN